MIKAFATAACWVLVLAGVQAAGSQTTGELSGIVRDATGAVVAGATVTLTGKTLPAPVAIETDDEGRFAISLAPGPYEVSAGVAGFEPWRRDVIVSASGVTLDVTLEMSTRFSDRVTVTARRYLGRVTTAG
jgi:hypothetical protein